MEELELEQNEQLLEQRRLRRLEQKRRRKMQQRMVLGLLALIVVLALVLIVRGCRAKPAPLSYEMRTRGSTTPYRMSVSRLLASVSTAMNDR